jgi:hypothetical protein
MGPAPDQPCGQILQLRQFNLQFTFMAVRALGKYIQYQTNTVYYAAIEFMLQIPFLGWTQGMVENDDVGTNLCYQIPDFIHLTTADKKPGIRIIPAAGDGSPIIQCG